MVNIVLAKEKCIKFNLRSRSLLTLIEQYEQGSINEAQARSQALIILVDLRTMISQAQAALV